MPPSKTMLALAIAAALSTLPPSVAAFEEHTFFGPGGQDVLKLRLHGVGDGQYMDPEPDEDIPGYSTWDLSRRQKQELFSAAGYWAQIIRPKPGSAPAIVNVGTYDDKNAFGYSPDRVLPGEGSRSHMEMTLQGRPVPDSELYYGAHGLFAMGRLPYAEDEYRLSQLPLRVGVDLAAVAAHELAHGLGMANVVQDLDGPDTPHFAETGLNAWASGLRDDNGNPARPGQAVLCAGCMNPYDPDAFDARLDQAVFVGEHVRDALEGGLPGVPVKMNTMYPDGTFAVDDNYMSHIELRNSLMSHQFYRNYTRFMEAELALLQDLGYTIDRGNFFGRSIYGSGLDIVNDRPYFDRDAAGTAYLPGQYNRADLGLGLHVYGSHNRVRQVADLLSAGAGGAGIRVDGEHNTVIIDPGVRVHALGENGQGVMFAYGKGHQLVHRGDIQATGANGVGLRFDFGHNAMDSRSEYRGSHVRYVKGEPAPLLAELRGALADAVDITGSIRGSAAAIYISRSALVDRINVMEGAYLEGDIVSAYDRRDESGAMRMTTLTFGLQADESGRALHAPDPGFALSYAGNLRGPDNLRVSLEGGMTAMDGGSALHSMAVRPGAALAGNGHFTLSPEGALRNDGVLAPGDAPVAGSGGASIPDIGRIEVAGFYDQGDSGVLVADFDASGRHDVLAVDGTARLDGRLVARLLPDWYPNEWSTQAGVVQAGRTEGGFAAMLVADISPTLDVAVDAPTADTQRLRVTRAPDAYSRHAMEGNARRAGEALDRAAGSAVGSFQPLFSALDFSARDGSEVSRALTLVTPAGYSAGLAASLHRERLVMDTALRGFGQEWNGGGDWRGYAQTFGGKGDQDTRSGMVGYDASTYGLVLGGGRKLAANPAVALGVHLDIAEQSLRLDAPQWGKLKTTSFGLGAQLQYQPDAAAGFHAHAGFRVGVEHGSMDRTVAAGNLQSAHSADWTGHSLSVQTGGGYRWALSESISAGPVFAVNYAGVSRPGVGEDGDPATRLSLDRQRVDALRSSVGLAAETKHALREGGHLLADLALTWEHEWLDRDVVQTARFAAAPAIAFESVNAVVPRNSANLRAGLVWRRSEGFSVGAGLNGRVGDGYRSLDGQLSLRWAF